MSPRGDLRAKKRRSRKGGEVAGEGAITAGAQSAVPDIHDRRDGEHKSAQDNTDGPWEWGRKDQKDAPSPAADCGSSCCPDGATSGKQTIKVYFGRHALKPSD